MKKNLLKQNVWAFLLVLFTNLVLVLPSYTQDIDELTERYRDELQKIQSSEDSQAFFMTHIKDDFGLTNSMIGFLNGLEQGAYSRQIQYVMRVPIQRWNPNAGPGGWGRWDRDYAVRVVNKNQSGTLSNVTSLMSQIGDAMAIYSIGNDIVQAFYGDDKAKIRALYGTYSLVSGKLTSDFPGMSTAMLGVAFISYALNKFITTTLGEYSDYWWEKYRNYYLNTYPSFVEDWAALATQEGGFDIIEQRLEEEFWNSDEAILESDDAPTLYSQAEYAKNVMGAGFAAQYYRDYLQRNIESWVRTRTEQGLLDVWSEYRNDSRSLQEIVQELQTLRELIQYAEEQMANENPVSITITPAEASLEVGESINFTAIAVFEDESSTNITDLEETNWSIGSHTFTANHVGESEISVTFRGVTATTTVTVVDRTPVSLTLSPSQATLEIGETEAFTALAIYEDGTSQDITQLGSTEWNIGSNTFTAQEPGEEVITASYRGLSAQATVTTVEGDGQSCTDENATWNADRQQCICNDGYEPNAELGKCISLDEALDKIAEEDEGALCDETELAEKLVRLNELAASGNRMAANFQSMFRKFLKEINDQNSNPCTNSLVAYTYASAKEIHTEYQAMADEATEISTDLMLEGALCPLEELELDVTRILQTVSEVGRPMGQIEDGIATMENELLTYGCDEQDVSDLGDTIADRSTNPEVIESGGVGTTGVTNPGGPGGPSTEGTYGAIAVTAGDLLTSSLNVTVRLNNRSFNFSVSQGNFDQQHFQNVSVKEGDRMQINAQGTGLNPSIILRETDFFWVDPNTQTSTTPGNGNRILVVVIGVYYDDDEDEMRYKMQVTLGAAGYGYPGSPGGGRVLRY